MSLYQNKNFYYLSESKSPLSSGSSPSSPSSASEP